MQSFPENSNFHGDWNALCTHCGKPHKDHIDSTVSLPDYVHRMPCVQEREAITKAHDRFIRNAKWLANAWRAAQLLFLVAIPFTIEALGFAHYAIGFCLFVLVIIKATWLALDIFGLTEAWFPFVRNKKRLQREKTFWHEQYRKNPDAFRRLLLEIRTNQNGKD